MSRPVDMVSWARADAITRPRLIDECRPRIIIGNQFLRENRDSHCLHVVHLRFSNMCTTIHQSIDDITLQPTYINHFSHILNHSKLYELKIHTVIFYSLNIRLSMESFYTKTDTFILSILVDESAIMMSF